MRRILDVARARPGAPLVILHALFLVVLWVALWGSLTFANVAGGVVVAAVLLTVFPLAPRESGRTRIRPVSAIGFAAYFLVKLVQANLQMAVTILGPKSRVRPGIVAVPVRGVSDGLTTLVANFITLTPGTLTVEVAKVPGPAGDGSGGLVTVLYIHVMTLGDPDDVRREVAEIERRAVRAFGSPEAVAALRAEVTP